MRVAMPIGKDDFASVRNGGYYYVDKTDVIARLLDHPAEVTLFTRPRRFGKTMFLSMMRYFLDIEGAEENKKLFDGLKIAENSEVMKEQGSRPVLFFSLKGWKADSWDEMQQVIQDALGQIFDERAFLLKTDGMTKREQMIFESIQMGTASLIACRSSLVFLLRLLEKYYGKRPVLLLDEYDVPIQQSWEHGYYEKAITFFREFLSSALKTNPSLDFSVLTGVLRISKESIFSDLNNLLVDSVFRTQYPEAFGFTLPEIETLAKDLGKEEKLAEVREWYDGYHFGGREIYNPWSVLNYFANGCVPDAYWVNTSGNVILGELLRHTDQEHLASLETLLQGGTVQGDLQEGVIYSDIGKDEAALYTMLCTTGYLTVEGKRRVGNIDIYALRLPNREMQRLFGREILRRFPQAFNQSSLVRLMEAMLDGDAQDGERRGRTGDEGAGSPAAN